MMDQLLRDAKTLVQRLQSHDNSADSLISEATHLQNKLHAMKQYRDEVSKLNEVAKHRPKSTLILGSHLENQRIQELELEVGELTVSLAENQSALELIMNKYREQVLCLLESNGLDKGLLEHVNQEAEDVKAMKEKILEMAAIMQKAMRVDDATAHHEIEAFRGLQAENETLRELLHISGGRTVDTSTVIRRKPKQENNIGVKERIKLTQNDKTDYNGSREKRFPSNSMEAPTKQSDTRNTPSASQVISSTVDSSSRASTPTPDVVAEDNVCNEVENMYRNAVEEQRSNNTHQKATTLHADTSNPSMVESNHDTSSSGTQEYPVKETGSDDVLAKHGYLEKKSPDLVADMEEGNDCLPLSSDESERDLSPPSDSMEDFLETTITESARQNEEEESAGAALAMLDDILMEDDEDSDEEESVSVSEAKS